MPEDPPLPVTRDSPTGPDVDPGCDDISPADFSHPALFKPLPADAFYDFVRLKSVGRASAARSIERAEPRL